MALIVAIVSACEEGPNFREFEYPAPVVEDFSPKSGRPGTEVTISGSNFGELQPASEIKFNGVIADNIISYSNNAIVVAVPDDAGEGPIELKVWMHVKTTSENFGFIPGAKLGSLSVGKGQPGEMVTVTGTNFGDDPGIVSVTIGDVEAEIVSISDEQIVFVIPDTGSGQLSIMVGPQTLTGPFFLVGGEKLTGTLIGHTGSWGNNTATMIPAAVDGDFETFVDASSATGFVGYDLGEGKVAKLTSVRYAPRASHPQRMVGGEIRGANDPSLSDFVVLHTITETPTVGEFSEVQIDNEETYRYIYYYSPDGYCNISEIEFYGNLEIEEVPEGKYTFEFISPDDMSWLPSQNASYEVKDGMLRVTFDPAQFDGSKRRADIQYIINGALNGEAKDPWVYTKDYPILAFKMHNRPAEGNIRPDIRGASFGNNDYKKDFESQDVIYWDLAEKYTEDRKELDLVQVKIADITSDETGYEIDWIRTFTSKEELESFINN